MFACMWGIDCANQIGRNDSKSLVKRSPMAKRTRTRMAKMRMMKEKKMSSRNDIHVRVSFLTRYYLPIGLHVHVRFEGCMPTCRWTTTALSTFAWRKR